jgi:hypothetical protein
MRRFDFFGTSPFEVVEAALTASATSPIVVSANLRGRSSGDVMCLLYRAARAQTVDLFVVKQTRANVSLWARRVQVPAERVRHAMDEPSGW